MKKHEFLDMVKAEAVHLFEHATDKEKGKLNFSTLDEFDDNMCIYGQMTGNCFSRRATRLWRKQFSSLSEKESFTETMKQTLKGDLYTPMEVYITMKGAKTESLLKFIKGEIKTFKP